MGRDTQEYHETTRLSKITVVKYSRCQNKIYYKRPPEIQFIVLNLDLALGKMHYYIKLKPDDSIG